MALTREQFQSRLSDSGIMSAADLDAFASDLGAPAADEDPQALARALVEADRLTPFQAEVLLGEADRPLRLGRYLLLDRVGRGGMGQVHKAVHERMNRVVAIKILPPLAAMDTTLVARFRREVQVAAKLHHPHIVTAYDADEAEGLHFLVMELVDGRDLGAIVAEEGPLPVDEALDAIEQAARGLAYAHAEGVLHRDVKPANLLRDGTGRVKVLDMGLARLDASEGLTTTGEFLGTAMTMAPEQGDDGRLVDERSDVYGLGCTLHYLLTGRHVYEGDSAVQLLLAHARAPIPRLRDARPDAPEAVEQLFESMVQKDRDDRPQGMEAVVESVTAIRAGDAPDLPRRRARRRVGRRDLLAALGGLGLAGLGAWWLAGPGADDAPSTSWTASAQKHILLGHGGAVNAVAVHPDGRQVFTASSDATIGIWDLETGEDQGTLQGHADSVRSLLVLRDGNTLISSSDDTTIRFWDLTTRRTTKVVTGHEDKVRRLALAPDESWFVSASKDGSVRIWGLPDGEELRRTTEHAPWIGDSRGFLGVDVRADGRVLATGAFDRTVRVWDAASLDVLTTLGPHGSDVGFVAFSPEGQHLLYDLEGGDVRVMNGDATEQTAYLDGHEDWVFAIACAHGGPIVATGSQDATIRLWNLETGEHLATLEGHAYTVGALAFTADDRLLVSGSGDDTARVWNVAPLTTRTR